MIFYAKKITDSDFNFEPIFDSEHLDFISLDYQKVIDYVLNCGFPCAIGGYDVERGKKQK